METIRLTEADLMPDEEVDKLKGTLLFRPHYDRVIWDTTTVCKPDGSVLFTYVKDALPRAVCQAAFMTFKSMRFGSTDSRGLVAGGRPFRRQRMDGTLSNTFRWRPMKSTVVGFLDRDRRNPLCRMTSFTRNHFPAFEAAQPFIAEVNDLFRTWAPERWEAQREFVETVAPDFVIPGTVFTSVTVNRSERTAAHTDAHDYRPGFGVMTVLEGGRFYGCELIFPKYRTAVEMRTGGVCLADVHEWHGNAPLIGRRFVRLSFVFYAREHMHLCGSVEEERQRAAAMSGHFD